MSYYNTVNEEQKKVIEYTRINNGQDKIILSLIGRWDKYGTGKFSAKTIFKLVSDSGMPILMTSVRRSINTLKNAGLIEETGERVKGLYGRSELQYKKV